MSRKFLRILFLIWLGWYLAGPVIETFDSWDNANEEMLDIASSVCGALVWAAALVCLAIVLLRELLKHSSYLAIGIKPASQSVNFRKEPSSEEFGFILASPPLRI